MLETGVDPSVIDLARAKELGLKIDSDAGGEVSGGGDAQQATAFPSSIEALAIGPRSFPRIDALAFDLGTLSARYGRRLDGLLGYRFLKDQIVLNDYPRQQLALLDQAGRPRRWSACAARIGARHCGRSRVFASSAPFAWEQRTLRSAWIRVPIAASGETKAHSASVAFVPPCSRRKAWRTAARAAAPMLNHTSSTWRSALGLLCCRPGQIVTVRTDQGSAQTRVANVGNALLAALRLKVLLDYRHRQMSFYGDCR